uniref:Uncharacterized protein n=1 Tax=Cannabis sativa TaxID=3483 RepID=A0A803NMY6_CANSA
MSRSLPRPSVSSTPCPDLNQTSHRDKQRKGSRSRSFQGIVKSVWAIDAGVAPSDSSRFSDACNPGGWKSRSLIVGRTLHWGWVDVPPEMKPVGRER